MPGVRRVPERFSPLLPAHDSSPGAFNGSRACCVPTATTHGARGTGTSVGGAERTRCVRRDRIGPLLELPQPITDRDHLVEVQGVKGLAPGVRASPSALTMSFFDARTHRDVPRRTMRRATSVAACKFVRDIAAELLNNTTSAEPGS